MAQIVMARPGDGPRTWTVIDEGYRTVEPIEDWLEAHRLLWSPNTVRGYATALSQWWTFLEQRVEADRWNEVGVPTVSAFVSWMRNGRRVERSVVPVDGPAPETMQARLAAVISFYTWHEAVSGVPVAGRLMRGAPRRAVARGLLAHLDARSAPAPTSLVRVRRRRRDRPPLLMPQQIQAILNGCATYDPNIGEWVGNLRDRLLFAVLAESGLFSGGRPTWRDLAPGICAAQKLLVNTLACAAGVVHEPGSACHRCRVAVLSCAMSSRLAARAAARSWSRSSSCRRSSMACCSS